MIAALFDMDNTLLRVDTGMSWTKFLYRRGELPRSMLAKAMYWAGLRRASRAVSPAGRFASATAAWMAGETG